mmetsp:Transcript_60042/g.155898  ORF Transcript_60042/g.155898 Transcript_60042/m.155898 type:complete len:244 (-) Transcript_60042:117-848(-)
MPSNSLRKPYSPRMCSSALATAASLGYAFASADSKWSLLPSWSTLLTLCTSENSPGSPSIRTESPCWKPVVHQTSRLLSPARALPFRVVSVLREPLLEWCRRHSMASSAPLVSSFSRGGGAPAVALSSPSPTTLAPAGCENSSPSSRKRSCLCSPRTSTVSHSVPASLMILTCCPVAKDAALVTGTFLSPLCTAAVVTVEFQSPSSRRVTSSPLACWKRSPLSSTRSWPSTRETIRFSDWAPA